MKTLVVYYSFEGNCRLIAEELQKAVDADICELKPAKEPSSHGFSKYVWGGFNVMMKKEPELINVVPPLDGYDLVILGSPVWAFTYAPAMRSFLHKYNGQLKNKMVAVYYCHRGGPGKTGHNFQLALKDAQFLGKTDFFEPKDDKDGKAAAKVCEWINEITEHAKTRKHISESEPEKK